MINPPSVEDTPRANGRKASVDGLTQGLGGRNNPTAPTGDADVVRRAAAVIADRLGRRDADENAGDRQRLAGDGEGRTAGIAGADASAMALVRGEHGAFGDQRYQDSAQGAIEADLRFADAGVAQIRGRAKTNDADRARAVAIGQRCERSA